MNTNNASYKTEILDGQVVYVPERSEWEGILKNKEFIGMPVGGYPDWFKYRIELTEKYPELTLALYQAGLSKFGLLPIVLLKIDNDFQRVHIENLTCDVCGWNGATANPMLSELYLGTPDRFSAMRSAERFSIQPCPRCGSKLPRHPIWVEPIC